MREGDDLGVLVANGIRSAGLAVANGDVIVITQKVVSKAEGRVVAEPPDGKAAVVAGEIRRVVARRGDLVIGETRHGFVCANGGVDASNVAEGFLALLPEDPDGSAERLRSCLAEAFGATVGVVITDTFGRAWRHGLVNVAIGCAGLPAVIDLRGTKDASGRLLEVTIVALADEVAAASGLVMGKADGVPVAIVRGLRLPEDAAPSPASLLVRAPGEDLFRESPLQAVQARGAGSRARFGPEPVPDEALLQAIRAAGAASDREVPDAPLFVVLRSRAARARLLASAGVQWTAAGMADAPGLVVPFVRTDSGETGDAGFSEASGQRGSLLLRTGQALERLLLALRAQGLAVAWITSPGSRHDEIREALGLDEGWDPLGCVAAGWKVDADEPEPVFDPAQAVRFVD